MGKAKFNEKNSVKLLLVLLSGIIVTIVSISYLIEDYHFFYNKAETQAKIVNIKSEEKGSELKIKYYDAVGNKWRTAYINVSIFRAEEFIKSSSTLVYYIPNSDKVYLIDNSRPAKEGATIHAIILGIGLIISAITIRKLKKFYFKSPSLL
ncbi:MAG: hypothetical protein M0D57_00645 [Sphingobacteriales bacterium JAD_PAG50586_3]|nr:MAG: hypothetical protein M0D57_00645 [Sphingobacteriales bacterium JAD_PAG50586_3]